MNVNDNFKWLSDSYLFSEVAARVSRFRERFPGRDVIRMDIGDVTLPIFPAVAEAMRQAVTDLSDSSTFMGYGPEQGYPALREAIALNDYRKRGIAAIGADDIFVSDGAKSDLGNIFDLFARDSSVAVPDPGYPVYADAAGIAGFTPSGETGGRLLKLHATASEGFLPTLPATAVDVVFICSPSNPTGTAMTREIASGWVEYARRNGTLLVFDSAYEAYVTSPGVIRSIYEIEGAEEVAMEVRSFSKSAGFTGIRCGYTVVPRALKGRYSDGSAASLHDMWLRRQTTKFNGASCISQAGALALYSPEGERCVREAVGTYLGNARRIAGALRSLGWRVFGAVDSPYVWASPGAGDSWGIFDRLLEKCGISSTPGIGFGNCGDGYVRLTGFNTPSLTDRAISRLLSTP